MIKLRKYLKPFLLLLVLAVGLLYVQAQTDLALPDYMSDIVNVGIQQSGVTTNIPNVIAETDMQHISLLATENEKEIIKGGYELVEVTESHKQDYSSLQLGESIYILKNISDEELANLENTMGPVFIMIMNIQSQINSGEDFSMNGMTFPKGTDIFKILDKQTPEQLETIVNGISKSIGNISSELLNQMGIKAVKDYYNTLGFDESKIQSAYILKIGGWMIFITIIGAISSILVGLISSKIAAGVAKNMRKDVFSKVMSFTSSEFDQFSTASLITRSTNDITQIQSLLVMMIRMMFYAPILGFGGVMRALDKSNSMSWIIAVAVIVLLGFILVIFAIAMPRFKKIQKMVDKINLITREHLSGMMVIRAFNTQKFEEKRFDNANMELTDMNLFINRIMALLFPAMMLIMNGVTVLIIWVGAHQIAESAMQVGDMMAFMQYAMQIIMSFLMLSMMFIMIPRASVSASRIAEVLDTEITILDVENPKKMKTSMKGVIQFENVYFRYPGAEEDVLKDITFEAKAGQMTAIIGATGSGKTTLVNLITRFYDTTRGIVYIGGEPIKEIEQRELREHIGYVPQKALLMSGTIESNLKFGRPHAAENEIEEAIDIAQARVLIDDSEEGIQRVISQGGQNLSGGQKQRLSIARALVKDPDIYIFDDSFSALDFKTDSNLRKALKETTADKTVLIVAQRISTIKNANQIIVLEDGEMVGKGTHSELMETCDAYIEIASSQFSKEEL
ncbi:MAG: ABC transporter ATP-binding protein [Clostridiales bacterium]|nr:ABC transporter ATP-binding protein [Clostridiales bacterium]